MRSIIVADDTEEEKDYLVKNQTCLTGGSLQDDQDGMHQRVYVSAIWETKRAKVSAQLRGISVMSTHPLHHLTERHIAHEHANTRVCGKR